MASRVENALIKKIVFLLAFLACSVNAAVNVSDCANLVAADTYYTLNKSFDTTNVTCFDLAASNVTFDCQGFTINYSGLASWEYIISAFFPNATIKNCNLNETADAGGGNTPIFLAGSTVDNATVFNNSIISRSASTGIFLNDVLTANLSWNNITMLNGFSYGVQLYDVNDSVFYNNTIVSNGTGILIGGTSQSSNNFFYGLNVSTSELSGNAIFFDSDNTPMVNNVFNASRFVTSGVDGIASLFKTTSLGSVIQVVFNDCNFSSYNSYDANLAGGHTINVNFTNSSFNKSRVFNGADGGTLNVFWRVNVQITNTSGDSLSNANVNASDKNRAANFNLTSNATGWLAQQAIMEYYMIDSSDPAFTFNKTPHYFVASKDNFVSNSTIQYITESKTIVIALDYTAATLNVLKNGTAFGIGQSVALIPEVKYANGTGVASQVVNVTVFNSTGWNSSTLATTNSSGQALVSINGLSSGAYTINASVARNETALFNYAVNSTEAFSLNYALLSVAPVSVSVNAYATLPQSVAFNVSNVGSVAAANVGCWEVNYDWISILPLNLTYGNASMGVGGLEQLNIELNPTAVGSFSTTVFCNGTGLNYANISVSITVLSAPASGGGGGGYPPVVNASFLVYPTEITPPLFSSAVSGSLIRLSDVFILNFGNSSIDLTSSFKCSSAEGCAADWCSLNRSTPSFSLASQQTEVLQTFCRIPLNTLDGYYYSTLVIEQSSTGLQQGVKVTLKVGGDVVSDSLDYGSDLFSGLFEPLTACVVSLGEAREGCLVNAGAAFDIAGIHVASIQLWVLLVFVVVLLGVFFTVL